MYNDWATDLNNIVGEGGWDMTGTLPDDSYGYAQRHLIIPLLEPGLIVDRDAWDRLLCVMEQVRVHQGLPNELPVDTNDPLFPDPADLINFVKVIVEYIKKLAENRLNVDPNVLTPWKDSIWGEGIRVWQIYLDSITPIEVASVSNGVSVKQYEEPIPSPPPYEVMWTVGDPIIGDDGNPVYDSTGEQVFETTYNTGWEYTDWRNLQSINMAHTVEMTKHAFELRRYPVTLPLHSGGTTWSNAVLSDGVTYDSGTGELIVPPGISVFTITLVGLGDFLNANGGTYSFTLDGITATGGPYVAPVDYTAIDSVTNVERLEGEPITHTVRLNAQTYYYQTPTARTIPFSIAPSGLDPAEPYIDYNPDDITFTNKVEWDPVAGTLLIPEEVLNFEIVVQGVKERIGFETTNPFNSLKDQGTETYQISIGGVTAIGTIADPDPRYWTGLETFEVSARFGYDAQSLPRAIKEPWLRTEPDPDEGDMGVYLCARQTHTMNNGTTEVVEDSIDIGSNNFFSNTDPMNTIDFKERLNIMPAHPSNIVASEEPEYWFEIIGTPDVAEGVFSGLYSGPDKADDLENKYPIYLYKVDGNVYASTSPTMAEVQADIVSNQFSITFGFELSVVKDETTQEVTNVNVTLHQIAGRRMRSGFFNAGSQLHIDVMFDLFDYPPELNKPEPNTQSQYWSWMLQQVESLKMDYFETKSINNVGSPGVGYSGLKNFYQTVFRYSTNAIPGYENNEFIVMAMRNDVYASVDIKLMLVDRYEPEPFIPYEGTFYALDGYDAANVDSGWHFGEEFDDLAALFPGDNTQTDPNAQGGYVNSLEPDEVTDYVAGMFTALFGHRRDITRASTAPCTGTPFGGNAPMYVDITDYPPDRYYGPYILDTEEYVDETVYGKYIKE